MPCRPKDGDARNSDLLRIALEMAAYRYMYTDQPQATHICMVNAALIDDGSVQNPDLLMDLGGLHKASWAARRRIVLDTAADRGQFVPNSRLVVP